jgi:hypothetical protein
MRRLPALVFGLFAGAFGAHLTNGCSCPEATVHDIDDGTYILGVGPRNEIGEDTEYLLTVSEGGSRAVEVFVREGVTHRYEYAVTEAVESSMRNDMGQSSD